MSNTNTSVECFFKSPRSRSALQNRGCIVYTARDGKECLDLVLGSDAKSYDLISLDNDMVWNYLCIYHKMLNIFQPVMTGEEAVKAMREAGRSDFVVGTSLQGLLSLADVNA